MVIVSDLGFLLAFGVALLQLTSASLFGIGIGTGLGAITGRSPWLAQSTSRFLRVGVWLPSFVYWGLPVWPPDERNPLAGILLVWAVTASTATLSTCYHFLAVGLGLHLEPRAARRHVNRAALLDTLFVSIVSQMWMGAYSWVWVRPRGAPGVGILYGAILLALLLILINYVFRSSFDQSATIRGAVVLKEVAGTGGRSLGGAFALAIAFLGVWQILSKAGLHPWITSPVEFLKALHSLLIGGTSVPRMEPTVWRHLAVSGLELLWGLLLGGGAALMADRFLSAGAAFKKYFFSLVSVTFAIPLLAPLFLMELLGLTPSLQRALGSTVFPLQTTAAVALTSFFPFIHALWGLRDHPGVSRVVLAADNALPFSFLALFFGEAAYATAGVELFITAAVASSHTGEALAASLAMFFLFVGLSSALRSVVKRSYFAGKAI